MIFKRKDSRLWWARFTTPNGKRLRVSTGTENRKQAQEFADQLKAKTWNVQKLGEKPERGWQEAVLRWLDETTAIKQRRKTTSVIYVGLILTWAV
jgi:hypothetical protein